MSLGSKILLGIFSISILIASVGITSNWYTNSILSGLVNKNAETTKVVELTANIENELYQSLVILYAIKDVESANELTLTLNEPTEEMYIEEYKRTLFLINSYLGSLTQILTTESNLLSTNIINDINRLRDSCMFFEQLSNEWLTFRGENKVQAHQMFSSTLSPYFRNNIIPVITNVRREVINQQNIENVRLDDQLSSVGVSIISITSLMVFISLGIAGFLYRSIADPLKQLNESAQKLGAGDLEERVYLHRNDELGELAASFNSMASNLRKRTLARDYLDNIIESIQEALIVTDEHGNIVGLNHASEKLLGFNKSELNDVPLNKILSNDHFDRQLEKPISTSEKLVETHLITKNNKMIPVLFSESSLLNSKGDIVGKVVVATDITERNKANDRIRESLREKEILLAEIHHRVKNNLAVVSGILQLQSGSSKNKEVEEALMESQTRIKSISLVHEMLYQSETMANIDYEEYVLDLTVDISKLPLAVEKNINIVTEAEPVLLDLNTAVPCSMLLNEILVDRIKNSFHTEPNGLIRVLLRNLDSNIELTVEHNGEIDGTNNTRQSLGHTLIKTLINQLHGTFYEEYLKEKQLSRIRIIFPIDVNRA